MSKRKANPKPTLTIAFDPGSKMGVAYQIQGETMVTVKGTQAQVPQAIRDLLADPQYRVYCAVERSSARIPIFRAHRADAKRIGDLVRSLAPRRNSVVYVDPRTWQSALGVCHPDKPNGFSMPYSQYAEKVLSVPETATEDEKAAACILHWHRQYLRLHGVKL